jgi:hypothetical protein
MAKAYSPEDLATRTFVITMAGVLTFIAVVFVFIIK